MSSAFTIQDFFGLNDRVVLVTGSTAGIGKGIARKFAQIGARVFINGRTAARVDATVAEFAAEEGLKVESAAGDVGTEEGARQVYETVIKAAGKLDVLVNNTGFFDVEKFQDVSDEKYLQYHNINTMSGIRLARLALDEMLKRNDGARIIFIASEAGVRPIPHMIPYSMSKSTNISVARGLAELTKSTTVTVNSVLVGPTWTEGVESYIQQLSKEPRFAGRSIDEVAKAYFKELEPTSLIQRFLTVDEVGSTVAFLGSRAASGINGVAQRVEGGLIRHI